MLNAQSYLETLVLLNDISRVLGGSYVRQENVYGALLDRLKQNKIILERETFAYEARIRMSERGRWLSLYSGKRFYLGDPLIEDIDIVDIAHALALICRFGGHYTKHYSVAQHSLLVSKYCPKPFKLHGLMHDCAEGLTGGDLPSPLKKTLNDLSNGAYAAIEDRALNIVYTKFGVKPTEESDIVVKQWDMSVLAREIIDLTKQGSVPGFIIKEPPIPETIVPMPWGMAEKAFLDEFYRLTK